MAADDQQRKAERDVTDGDDDEGEHVGALVAVVGRVRVFVVWFCAVDEYAADDKPNSAGKKREKNESSVLRGSI